ncbi:MAG: ATP-binding cassette domain-containing protein [Rikenellaceae bacterium]
MEKNYSKPVISLKNVSIYNSDDPYGRLSLKEAVRRGELVVADINLDIYPGELVYLIGRVGSGKSSLLKTLYAELPLLVGEGCVVGYRLNGLRGRDIPYLRRKMGIVFQDYQLLDDRNVYMNLEYVMRATGWRSESEMRDRIDQVLNLVDLQVKGYKMPYELSGGEQQRLVIARALLNSPDLILADEPTGNLDPVAAEEIMKLFMRIVENGCAVVMSTHNISLFEEYPARVIRFSQGHIKDINLEKIDKK